MLATADRRDVLRDAETELIGTQNAIAAQVERTFEKITPAAEETVLGWAGIANGIFVSMAVLAFVLSLCSEADAFVAASLTMVPLVPRLVFLVVGPAVDLKLVAMQTGLFGRAFAVRFAPVTLLVATAVATGGDRDEAPGDRSGRTTLRATGCPADLPRVVRDAVQLVDAHVETAELAGVALPDRHHAGIEEAFDVEAGVLGDLALEGHRTAVVGPPLDRRERLDAERHPAERLGDVGLLRRRQCPLGVECRERVQLAGLDRRQGCIELLDR